MVKLMANSEQTHSLVRDGKKYTWKVEELWKLSEKLKPFEFDVGSCSLLDEDCWFGDRYEPTIRKVLEHCQKMQDANFAYPIILSEDNVVMDGLHRICKAVLENKSTILAVKFETNPEPNQIDELT
jgi:hypothetical protein